MENGGGRNGGASSSDNRERLALREVPRFLLLRYQTRIPPSTTTMTPATTPPMIGPRFVLGLEEAFVEAVLFGVDNVDNL